MANDLATPDEEIEEIDVTNLIERIEKLEKENNLKSEKIKELDESVTELERECETLGASIDKLADHAKRVGIRTL